MKDLFCFAKKCARYRTVSSYQLVHVTPISSLYCIITAARKCVHNKMRGYMKKFFMLSSKFRTNHGEADFYLHTFPRSNCVMRPFSKWCPGRVQSKSCSKEIWFNFHTVKSKCDHAKVILVSTTPFEMLKKASFWIPKDTFQSIKKDFTPLVQWQPPISFSRL